jgi:hypothetical protein
VTKPVYHLCVVGAPIEPTKTVNFQIINIAYVWFHSDMSDGGGVVVSSNTEVLKLDFTGDNPLAQTCRFTKDQKWVKLPLESS